MTTTLKQKYAVPGMEPVDDWGDDDLVLALRGFGHEIQICGPSGKRRFELYKLNPADPDLVEDHIASYNSWEGILRGLRRRVQ